MKIISFNVNGIRAIAQKNFFEDMENHNPDILCVQKPGTQSSYLSKEEAAKLAAPYLAGGAK